LRWPRTFQYSAETEVLWRCVIQGVYRFADERVESDDGGMAFRRSLCVSLLLWWCVRCVAGVVGFEITSRHPSRDVGYEEIGGVLRFEVDPRHPQNALIVDIGLAPVNAEGRVEFSADVRILTPVDGSARNGDVWFEIPNRGGKSGVPNGFADRGFSFIQVGWEFDVATDPGKLALRAPRARNSDGSLVRGLVSAIFTPDKPLNAFELSDLKDYPPVGVGGMERRLVVRDRAAFPEGQAVPEDCWSVEGGKVHVRGGLIAGRTYEIFYESEGPPVGGLGYAAIRDAVEWFRNDASAPVHVSHAFAFGSSQCGRFLRDLIYLGFNTDEHGRAVFDGVMAHIAGAGRLVLNRRWSTPRSVAGYETASYPFADRAFHDPQSGGQEGILENPRVRHQPKIFYTNMGAEYWGGGRVAALTHLDPTGKEDRDFPLNVRSYFFSGTAHGPSGFPPAAPNKGGLRGNPVNPNPSILALRQAMYEWVVEGVEPPESVVPRLSAGALTDIRDLEFPKVPGVVSPRGISAGGRVANLLLPGGGGAGRELPLVVPRVDGDGHDLGGIRMPEVTVPLGTALGWVFRAEIVGAPHELYLLRGAWIPFARTRGERDPAVDARASIEERYPTREVYLERIEAAARELVEKRFLLETEVRTQVRLARDRWDWVMGDRGR